MKRCIFHIDMDAFFASVETVYNPSLKGKPVIVGGRPDSRGVVSTCSYEARLFGVRSAMPLNQAYRLCPHGIFLEGNYPLYRECSNKIISIFYDLTPFVEVVSIDEAYMDVSALLIDISSKELALKIKERVKQETGLTCTVGVAANKLVAKIASSKGKPDGLLEIESGTESEFLSFLPIQSIPGVGVKTQEAMNRRGIKIIADLQAIPLNELLQIHGAWGYHYHQIARGIDNRPVHWQDTPPKSISAETTFASDLVDKDLLEEALKELFQKAYHRLRAHKMRSKRISIKLRDSHFKTFTHSLTLPAHSIDSDFLRSQFIDLFRLHYQGLHPLRLIGVSLEQLTDSYWQPTFC